jgi:hypothetical protein
VIDFQVVMYSLVAMYRFGLRGVKVSLLGLYGVKKQFVLLFDRIINIAYKFKGRNKIIVVIFLQS